MRKKRKNKQKAVHRQVRVDDPKLKLQNRALVACLNILYAELLRVYKGVQNHESNTEY